MDAHPVMVAIATVSDANNTLFMLLSFSNVFRQYHRVIKCNCKL
ncbi:Hypothetical protein ETEE_p1090 (plasmid) [Edwardsiella anguillarum ET080813]|uniref:Uncharacterized protein n=1 Tax=Edwardsiella anguillarum ET080813 TaxID=667120 RepID=A0A076LRT4_9GAMM|nr:Hypothetical protein ETEE_p1090 [Edwardsiella anguillarum ET080813]